MKGALSSYFTLLSCNATLKMFLKIIFYLKKKKNGGGGGGELNHKHIFKGSVPPNCKRSMFIPLPLVLALFLMIFNQISGNSFADCTR